MSEAERGVYALVIQVEKDIRGLRVGRLGELDFSPGYYVYVGSAHTGLRPRVQRHLGGGGDRRHWHIDYLAGSARPQAALGWRTERDFECELSGRIGTLADGSVDGFGCSDCRCGSHLYYFRSDPRSRLQNVRLCGPDGGHIRPFWIEREKTGSS